MPEDNIVETTESTEDKSGWAGFLGGIVTAATGYGVFKAAAKLRDWNNGRKLQKLADAIEAQQNPPKA